MILSFEFFVSVYFFWSLPCLLRFLILVSLDHAFGENCWLHSYYEWCAKKVDRKFFVPLVLVNWRPHHRDYQRRPSHCIGGLLEVSINPSFSLAELIPQSKFTNQFFRIRKPLLLFFWDDQEGAQGLPVLHRLSGALFSFSMTLHPDFQCAWHPSSDLSGSISSENKPLPGLG